MQLWYSTFKSQLTYHVKDLGTKVQIPHYSTSRNNPSGFPRARSATQVCRYGTVTVTVTDGVCGRMTSLSELTLIHHFKPKHYFFVCLLRKMTNQRKCWIYSYFYSCNSIKKSISNWQKSQMSGGSRLW